MTAPILILTKNDLNNICFEFIIYSCIRRAWDQFKLLLQIIRKRSVRKVPTHLIENREDNDLIIKRIIIKPHVCNIYNRSLGNMIILKKKLDRNSN